MGLPVYHTIYTNMLRNYFLIAYRNLRSDKANSFINLSGLALGMACSILIYLYVKDEVTFDEFHSKSDRIFRAHVHETYDNGEVFSNTVTPLPMAQALTDAFAEVEKATRYGTNSALLKHGDEQFRQDYAIGDDTFFGIFDFDVTKGSLIDIFSDRSDAVLTETQAFKLYGQNDPIGASFQLLLGDDYRNFVVKAVIKDIPGNSSLQFPLIISTDNFKYTVSERQMKAWFLVFTETYVLMKNRGGVEKVLPGIPAMVDRHVTKGDGLVAYDIGFQNLTDIHLNTSFEAGVVPVGDPKYIYILSFIASFILLIACINFTTLNIGRSVNRAKEIGVRKVNGAYKHSLIAQFLTESFVISLVSMGIGVLSGWFVIDLFNELSGKSIVYAFEALDLIFLGIVVVTVSLLSGVYPAFVLSSFQPVEIFRGKTQLGRGKQLFRKSLVVVQFVLSLFMITSAVFIRGQLEYLQNKDLGFNQEAISDDSYEHCLYWKHPAIH